MKRFTNAVLLGMLVALIGCLVALSPLGLAMERNLGLPWLFGVRGPLPSPPHVAVVGINGETGSDLGLPALPRDWPRSIHGELIEQLVALNAAVIVFDIHFSRTKDPVHDKVLVEAVRNSDRVVLFERLTGKTQPVMDVNGNKVGEVWTESLVPPFTDLAKAARALGVFPLPKIDAAVHEFWTFKDSVSFEPSMPAAALQLFVERRDPDWRRALRAPLDDGSGDLVGTMRALRDEYLLRTDVVQVPGEGALIASLKALYAGDEHRYLNFYGPPGTIRNIPFQDVMSGRAIEADLTDTVVFIGYSDLYDPGQLDRFYTVYTRDDGVDLAGVEIAATSFSNLLQDSALEPLGVLEQVLLLSGFGVAFCLIAYQLPAAFGVSLCIALWLGYGVLAQRLFGHSVWLPLTVPLLVQAPLALFMGVYGQYRLERERGQRISAAINYYLPETIAREFAAGRIDPESANNVSYGTCFATDMAGFSTIAQGMNPRELAEFLNEYFEDLANALNVHKVDVTEFRADAIMCAWMGAENEDKPRRRAILGALEARAVVDQFGEEHHMGRGSLRVGLESGWFYVGHAGGGGHFVYSIVGDCANTASRLEGLNKYLGTQIIASGSVIAGIEDFLYRPLGLFQLKGKDAATPVYEILGPNEEHQTRPAILEPFAAALEAYQQHDLTRAQSAFGELCREWPEDGPTQFFLRECDLGQARGPMPGEHTRVVRMDTK